MCTRMNVANFILLPASYAATISAPHMVRPFLDRWDSPSEILTNEYFMLRQTFDDLLLVSR